MSSSICYSGNFAKGRTPSWLAADDLPADASWTGTFGTQLLGKKEILVCEVYDLSESDLSQIVAFAAQHDLKVLVTTSTRRDRMLSVAFVPAETGPTKGTKDTKGATAPKARKTTECGTSASETNKEGARWRRTTDPDFFDFVERLR